MAGTPHGNAQWANRAALVESGFKFSSPGGSHSIPKNEFILGKWIETPTGEPHPMHTALYEGRKFHSKETLLSGKSFGL